MLLPKLYEFLNLIWRNWAFKDFSLADKSFDDNSHEKVEKDLAANYLERNEEKKSLPEFSAGEWLATVCLYVIICLILDALKGY